MKKTNVHNFEVGSEVFYRGHSGVIKWIGYPPDCKVKMAGLEMVKYATLWHMYILTDIEVYEAMEIATCII